MTREEALERVKGYLTDYIRMEDADEIDEIMKAIKPKTGYWIEHDTYCDCSLCGCLAPCTETATDFWWKMSNFCPDCGARMIGIKKESEEEK